MKTNYLKIALVCGVAVFGWLGTGSDGHLVGSAEAVIGRPATPMSYAGVARRTTVRHAAYATPGAPVATAAVVAPVATAAVVAPVATAAVVTPGVGVNAGGPVNRVGVR